jgi:hypothetical protein
MSWIKKMQAVRAEISKKNLPTSGLETLARMVPLKATDENVSAVGSAIESELRDRYVRELADVPTETILTEVATLPEQYESSVDSARSDALQRVLEIRFPSKPDDPDPIDTYDDTAGITFGQHLANWYRALNNND